jgi:hypothetical protein
MADQANSAVLFDIRSIHKNRLSSEPRKNIIGVGQGNKTAYIRINELRKRFDKKHALRRNAHSNKWKRIYNGNEFCYDHNTKPALFVRYQRLERCRSE